jgi:hypothetical protein
MRKFLFLLSLILSIAEFSLAQRVGYRFTMEDAISQYGQENIQTPIYGYRDGEEIEVINNQGREVSFYFFEEKPTILRGIIENDIPIEEGKDLFFHTKRQLGETTFGYICTTNTVWSGKGVRTSYDGHGIFQNKDFYYELRLSTIGIKGVGNYVGSVSLFIREGKFPEYQKKVNKNRYLRDGQTQSCKTL